MSSATLIRKFSDPVKVTRFNQGTYVAGQFEDTGYEQFTIYASIQPLTGKELVDEPIARRIEGSFRMYTDSDLNITNILEGRKADLVEWLGQLYEVQTKERWGYTSIRHYKYVIRRVTNPELERVL